MGDRPFDLHQNIFKDHHSTVRVIPCHENTLDEKILGSFLSTATDDNIGVAAAYGAKCALGMLAFASFSQVLLVRLSSSKLKTHGKNKQSSIARKLLRDSVLCHPDLAKFAFRMDRLAVALYLDLSLRITSGVDLLSVTKADRQSLEAVMHCLGGETTLHKANVINLFKQDEKISTPRDVALQAWAACRAATLAKMASKLAMVPRITTSTESFDPKQLLVLAKTLRDADRLMALKPTKTKNEVEPNFSYKQGTINLTSTRFKTRVRPTNGNQTFEIATTSKGKCHTVSGRATKVNGRAATITLNGKPQGHAIHSITTIGREDPTSAEQQRANIVLHALQRSVTILEQPFVQAIWLPSILPSWVNCPLPSRVPATLYFPSQRSLNIYQTKAVEVILSNQNAHRIQLIHGPPGTGKTTVIAASVTSIMASADRSRTLWLVAQSNVAVKNIAEKLATVGFFDFKLLVSKDFHFDWHEHLYQKLYRNVIRSDDFTDDLVGTERLLLGSRVILCTLSMLSNYRLATITRLVSVETVIFDEASQIEIGDYFPMLFRFQTTLRKLVFIGDDKQLAPFGESDINDLQSIFEMSHLRDRAIFLDTQYRLPIPIGTFISKNVYEHRLKSVHAITTKSSCRFVDVHNGKEVQINHSWVNLKEIQVVMALARKYHSQRKSYRIITPYDAQRSRLENGLKAAKLPWEDKCFNVDSFQGNEDDHIIISIVRSDKIGFLREIRRVNVMLTRCKKSMVICTSRTFVEGIASSSLVGALAMALGSQAWLDAPQVLYSNF